MQPLNTILEVAGEVVRTEGTDIVVVNVCPWFDTLIPNQRIQLMGMLTSKPDAPCVHERYTHEQGVALLAKLCPMGKRVTVHVSREGGTHGDPTLTGRVLIPHDNKNTFREDVVRLMIDARCAVSEWTKIRGPGREEAFEKCWEYLHANPREQQSIRDAESIFT